VAALLRVRGRAPHSGIGVDYQFAPLFTVRNGKIIRVDRFTDLEEALQAAGLQK
jgi:ketosteroid isomerase-like protein